MIGILSGAMGLTTLAGLAWYVYDLATIDSKEEETREQIAKTTSEATTQADIESIGSGTKAEQYLASYIYRARERLLIAGPINKTVYTLLRDYRPPNTIPQILTNPKLSNKMYVSNLSSRYGSEVKETDQILSDAIVLFYIDNNKTLLLRTADNTILTSTSLASANKLASKSTAMWVNSKRRNN